MSSASDDRALGDAAEQFYAQFMQAPTGRRHYQLDSRVRECDYSDCERMLVYLNAHADQPLAKAMRESVAIIQRVLQKSDRVAISFNGGKDATVVLHLARLVSLMEARERENVTPHGFFKQHFTSFVIHNDP